MFLSYVVFLGDLISIYLEKNILNLTFEENYVSALAVWWQTNVFQRSWWRPVWTSSKCFLTPLSSISINLYYVLYILALAAWFNKGHRILLHNTGPCHLCCHKTPSQGCHYPSHPAHIVTWPRRHRAPDNSQIIWWNQSGIAICISRGEASRKIHHKCINSSHVVNRYIRSTLHYYCLLKWVKNHEVIGYCDDDDFVILRQISWQSEQWTWHGGGRDIPWPGPEQDTVYSSIISRDDDLKFHPFQNHASAERFHSALFSSHNQARG